MPFRRKSRFVSIAHKVLCNHMLPVLLSLYPTELQWYWLLVFLPILNNCVLLLWCLTFLSFFLSLFALLLPKIVSIGSIKCGYLKVSGFCHCPWDFSCPLRYPLSGHFFVYISNFLSVTDWILLIYFLIFQNVRPARQIASVNSVPISISWK